MKRHQVRVGETGPDRDGVGAREVDERVHELRVLLHLGLIEPLEGVEEMDPPPR